MATGCIIFMIVIFFILTTERRFLSKREDLTETRISRQVFYERMFYMAKTYVPMAVSLAGGLHKRLTRYQAQLVNEKSSDQVTALAELISCLANFLAKWPKPPVNP